MNIDVEMRNELDSGETYKPSLWKTFIKIFVAFYITKMSMTIEESSAPRDGFPRPFPDISSNVLEQFKLDGRVVVVTGAADGIGLAVSEAMAEARANVALWYNS